MPQETPRVTPEIGTDTMSDEGAMRAINLEHVAQKLASNILRSQVDIEKIRKFIGDTLISKNLITPGGMSEIEADF